MAEEAQEEQDDITHTTKASNGEGWDLELKYPEGDRKFVRIKVLRGRDLRKVLEIEKSAEEEDSSKTLVDVLCEFVASFTDLTAEEAEQLTLEDLHGIRGVIRRQVKKLMTG